jgi:hypothetical protein
MKYNTKSNINLEHTSLDIELNISDTEYKEKSLYHEIDNEYFDKYKLTRLDMIKKRYNEDNEILNFYNQYFNEIEKLEKIGMYIWKLFGDLWNEEKQTLILQILSLTLLVEKQYLKLKKTILKLNKNKSKSRKDEDIRFKKDISYLFSMISKNKDYYINNIEFIDINSKYSDLEKIQLKKREESKRELYKEYDRIYNDTINNC